MAIIPEQAAPPLTRRDAAIQYARNGWPVFPLFEPLGSGCSCNGGGECKKGKPGKHPRINEWQELTCDLASVQQWWEEWPDANIGLRLDGLAVVDIDVKPTVDGYKSLYALEAEHGTLDPRARQTSGSGGAHYLYDGVQGLTKHPKFRPGLDLLTEAGCCLVVEPSVHATGGVYKWNYSQSPLSVTREALTLTAPPQWLLDAATSQKPKTDTRVPASRMVAAALENIAGGSGRNDAGLWLFTQLRDNKYSRDEAVLHLRDWVNAANGATPGQDRYTMGEAQATLRSAFSKAAREPWADSAKEDQADVLLKMCDGIGIEYYHSGRDKYIRAVVGDHKEVWPVDAKNPAVREILTNAFFTLKGRAPGREAMNSVIDTIMARCGAGEQADVFVRFARNRDVIYLDLCDDKWRVIRVTKDGWEVLDDSPILFRRGDGAKALPIPVKGGSLDALRALINVGDDAQWILATAWLLGTFQPDGAFCHLSLTSGQGSGKTMTSRVLLAMVDPSEAGLNSLPKNEEDATISALHAGTLGFDNLSGCRAEMADTFCRFSTGQGYRTRTFYENLGITVVSVKLPILLNGIDATIMRGDLSERCISLKLPTITAKTRLTEQGIWDAFARLHPSLLGALLDAVSMGLRNLPKTHLVDSPRMSDFATWVSACEPAMPWKVGLFIEAYKRKGEEAYADLAEDDSVASALIDYIRAALRPGKEFTGSARELLRDLNEHMEGSPRDPKFWPQSPAALAHKLARLGPVLRSQGVEILKLPRTRGAWSRWRVSRAAAVGDLFPLDLQEAA